MTADRYESLQEFARLVTAAESIWCAALIRQGYPSQGQWAEFNKAIETANEFLVRAGYLCDICQGTGDEMSEDLPKKCWKCQGTGVAHDSRER